MGCATLTLVAHLFRVTVNLGSDAEVSWLTQVLDDLATITRAAQDLATYLVYREADRYVARIVARDGIQALVERARRIRLPSSYDWIEDSEPEDPVVLRDDVLLLILNGLSTIRHSPWADLVDQVRGDRISRRLPDNPYRFRSIRYQNPLAVEIIADAGAAATALAILLAVTRDWSARRRRENARADAEERVQRAAAADAENEAWFRAQVRQIWLRQAIASGTPISAEEIDKMLSSDSLPRSLDRLAELRPEISRRDIGDQ